MNGHNFSIKSRKDIFKYANELAEKLELDKDYKNCIKNSKIFTFKNPRARKEMILINQLAKAWDDFIKEHQKSEPTIERQHYFLLGNNKKNSGRTSKEYAYVKAHNLNYKDPLDKRIIFIEVKNGKKRLFRKRDRVMSTLHEVGHFIGNRRRCNPSEYNRKIAYIKLITSAFCIQLHRLILSNIIGVPSDLINASPETNTYINPQYRLLSFKLRKKIYDISDAIHEEITDKFKNELKSRQISNASSPDEQKAIEAGYFQYLEPAMGKVIKEMLDLDTPNANWIPQFMNILKDLSTNDDELTNKELARKIFIEIKKDLPIESQDATQKGGNCWVQSCGLLLQEIAADIFMLRITEEFPSASKYFKFIVDATIDLLEEYKIPYHYIEYIMNNGVILPRIIAVQQSIEPKMKSVDFSALGLGAKAGLTKRSAARFAGMKLINDVLRKYNETETLTGDDKEIQELFNPLHEAVKYAKKIACENSDEYIDYLSANDYNSVQKSDKPENKKAKEHTIDLRLYLKLPFTLFVIYRYVFKPILYWIENLIPKLKEK